MSNTITDANSSFSINVPSVFAIPVPIQGYYTDDAFDTDEVSPNEVKMGVDGNLSGGHTPYPVMLKFVLMADSPSIAFMDQWSAAEDAAQEAYTASATILAPSLGKMWNFTQGFLTKKKPVPSAKKTFESQTYELTFQSCTPQPYTLAAAV